MRQSWANTGRAAVLARGCEHGGLLLQMVGRILRPYEGKHVATLVDLRGVVHKHGLPSDDRVFSLDGKAGVSSSSDLPALRHRQRSEWLTCASFSPSNHPRRKPKACEKWSKQQRSEAIAMGGSSIGIRPSMAKCQTHRWRRERRAKTTPQPS